jgi:hypothetical protein
LSGFYDGLPPFFFIVFSSLGVLLLFKGRRERSIGVFPAGSAEKDEGAYNSGRGQQGEKGAVKS